MYPGTWGIWPVRWRLKTVWIRLTHRRKPLLYAAAGTFAVIQFGFVTEALVRARLAADEATSAVRFYARPLVLNVGDVVDRGRVERHLERMGYRRVRNRARVDPGEYYLSSSRWVIGRRSFRHYNRYQSAETVTIRIGWDDRIWSLQPEFGERMRRFVLEPELIHTALGDSRKDKMPVPLSAVPQPVIDAVLTIEDQRFYDHGGMDLRRVAGAGIANFKAGKVVQGGSTLTQQLAKNLFLSPRRTPIRKYRELLMALVLEARYDKDEILEAYLNEVYMGHHDGVAIHGVARGAELYFGKDISEVDVDEAAVLAGIIRGPNLYSPHGNPELALQRRNLVLDLMRERDMLGERDYEIARAAPLDVQEPGSRSTHGRYFVDYVTRQIGEFASLPERRGFSVFTTLDFDLQSIAENAVRDGLARLETEYAPARRKESPLQAALVAVNPETGEILAMVGGRDYGSSQFNRAVDARRQPGSAFKPVVALTALARRDGYTLASMVDDEPLRVETPAGLWEPSNYDGRFRGPVTLRSALERSLNVPFARIGMDVGPDRIAETARRLGLDGNMNPVPSLALGASEVTPLGLTRAFGVLAARGYRAEPRSVLAVMDGTGDLLVQAEPAGEQVYQPEEVYLVTSALRGAVERGTGRGLRRDGFRGDIAGKSGTTNDFRDAWFVGFTPHLALGVWVGFDDGRSIGLPGSRAALPIFSHFLSEALGSDGDGEFEQPSGLEVAAAREGSRWGCRGEPELFLPGTVPPSSCSSWYSNFLSSARRSVRNSRVYSILEELRERQRRSRRRGR